jgi:hypothetical protein
VATRTRTGGLPPSRTPRYVPDVDDLTTNRAHCHAMARVHGQDACYDTESLVAGADALEESGRTLQYTLLAGRPA